MQQSNIMEKCHVALGVMNVWWASVLIVNVVKHACSHSHVLDTKAHQLQHEGESQEFLSQVLDLLQYDNADSSFLVFFSMAVMAVLTNHYCQKSVRTFWCKPRSRLWWESVRSGMFGSSWWKENLRMSEATFNLLCSKLRPYIEKQVWTRCMHMQV